MILNRILEVTRERVAHLPSGLSIPSSDVRSFSHAIQSVGEDRNAIIAELKYASPTEGTFAAYHDLPTLAQAVIKGGCIALSIVTEPSFFGGSNMILEQVRKISRLPILRKDFIIDERQVYETRVLGADAILLIARILGERLPSFVDLSFNLGLEPLVEIHSLGDAERALATRAILIGINNRDLDTMVVDLDTTRQLSSQVSGTGRIVISMSGIQTPEDVRHLQGYCSAFLIGSAVMKAERRRDAVEGFVFA